jgi:5'-deoxynucleotidase YfbR-like HD superfamily hydrolase
VRTCIETEPRGLLFDYAKPRASAVHIDDIARALANTCRFGGHVKRFYSVAEHAILVHELVFATGASPAVCYAALHHDSHEAYLVDVPTPLKRLLGAVWPRIQSATDGAISDALGITEALLYHRAVKAADAKALLIEAGELKTSNGVGPQWSNKKLVTGPPWSVVGHEPQQAETLFLAAHRAARAACS